MKIITLLLLLTAYCAAQTTAGWIEVDSLSIPRIGHALADMHDGNILISGNGIDSAQKSAEIYDFSTRKWRNTSPMNVGRESHFLVTLENGKVLAVGGYKEQSCEIFDPVSETWSLTDSLPYSYFFVPTVTKMLNGNILVTGGAHFDSASNQFVTTAAAVIYDVNSSVWNIIAPMNAARRQHTATLLSDGRILAAGGTNSTSGINDCEIYDPAADTWTAAAPMMNKRMSHSAILLKNGNVFISGGTSAFNSCEVYDVTANRWISAGGMLANRTYHKVYYSSEIDKLIILGGDSDPENSKNTWEIYNPNSLQPVYKEDFPINQFISFSVQNSDERILIAGGEEFVIPGDLVPYIWATKRTWLFDAVTGLNEDKESVPEVFVLAQNYPNPFNPETMIPFTIPSSGKVTLKVFDITGRCAAVILDQDLEAGAHSVRFNADGLSSGIYLCRITAGNYTKTIKMQVLK